MYIFVCVCIYVYYIYIFTYLFYIQIFFNTNQLFDTQNSDVVKCSHTKYVYLYIYIICYFQII